MQLPEFSQFELLCLPTIKKTHTNLHGLHIRMPQTSHEIAKKLYFFATTFA